MEKAKGRSSISDEKKTLKQQVTKLKKFVIICGGECTRDRVGSEFFENSYVIAADSGYNTATELGIKPDLLVGDMDSIGEVPDDIEIYRVKAEKDDTDTMLAIDIAKSRGAEEIAIIGGGGGRADHWLSNIFMLESLADNGIRAELCDGVNRIFVLSNAEASLKQNGGYFGILALEDSVVSVSGCKYPLKNAPLKRTLPYAVSNEIIGDAARISVKGKIIVTMSIV